MNSNYLIVLCISIIFIGFIILCNNNNLESFNKWENGTDLYNKTWCKYNNQYISNGFINEKDFIYIYGDKVVNSTSTTTFKDICTPGNMDECIEKVHHKYPYITNLRVLQNINLNCDKYQSDVQKNKIKPKYGEGVKYRIKYSTNNDWQRKSRKHKSRCCSNPCNHSNTDNSSTVTYRKECLKPTDTCGSHQTLNQYNSTGCQKPIGYR